MRHKLKEGEKKVRLTITINNELDATLAELFSNKSKYIEWLIYQDLLKTNKLPKGFML